MEHFEQVRKYHFIFMLAKQPSSRLFISLFHPFQSNYLLSLCWRNSLHLVSSFLCFILFSQTICNINQQLQNPKNRKIMSQFKKARKNVMKDSFYIKLATYLVPSPSRSIALVIW